MMAQATISGIIFSITTSKSISRIHPDGEKNEYLVNIRFQQYDVKFLKYMKRSLRVKMHLGLMMNIHEFQD